MLFSFEIKTVDFVESWNSWFNWPTKFKKIGSQE